MGPEEQETQAASGKEASEGRTEWRPDSMRPDALKPPRRWAGIALGVLAAFVGGVVVFVVTVMLLAPSHDPGSWFGEFLDALPAGVTAGTLTFAAITTWVIVAAHRRKRREGSEDRPRDRPPAPTARR